ncbi:hypothetical protein A3C09_03850 [Candidatus Uhrbacteria bacterium RIFCSPHIGHO2_02_FULL_47_44]|uniref:Lipoprotein n=1 Tax=Candidatus Uhrbacteria bacterium RIFCSPLOWO2_02_FULL_48_18 TaxID=1802408 RepID=A0A1F7VCQ1_9BACT|nr:MAG: hypothetical protein A2839_00670 [Candidatus Uhrbacteria bacterium RIFCSPHIGHO2_01_FULL_47_10]OGL71812.1 MAG: hypothetical protein A3C09_03850 [Candidatus Uhrbacteria bacterium RIFCSPHIGHO2_02_FULL_47_44]OGL80614.1 MAG: hypothetical protein A3B20_04435 [Candidatus Uhrbacteria bacterium RIFCSPLOWO2_01_FULL_47_17]OGL88203.1 MAG: hypothetical protein A3I41_00545 [Candidatus Uhrbacteria bacterium RIFCSPLOWO2_02_FULL_48_18]
MKYSILFLVSLFLLGACGTFEESNAPAPATEEDLEMAEFLDCSEVGDCDDSFPDINITIELDCESVDSKKKGDICVSVCNECQSGSDCIDTDADWYPDTCVTPVEAPPAREPPPVLVACGGTFFPLGELCSGASGVCQENGTRECFEGKLICSTDPKGSASLATNEVCDGKDNDCDGETDEGTSLVWYFPDVDGDGYGTSGNALLKPVEVCTNGLIPSGYVYKSGDCDDSYDTIYPGKNCPFPDSNSASKLIVILKSSKKTNMVGYEDDPTTFYFKIAKTLEEVAGKWSSDYFQFDTESGFAELALNATDKYVRFNTIDAPGWWSTCGGAFNAFNAIDGGFALNPKLKVYQLKNGAWINMTSKVEMYEQPNDASKTDSGDLCSALLKL